MATITTTLPDDLLRMLTEKSRELSVPKNRLIEKSLRLYLDHLEKVEYIRSYTRAKDDKDILSVAEEGMEDYLDQLNRGESEISNDNSGSNE